MAKSAVSKVASALGEKAILFDLERWSDDAGLGGNWYIRGFYRGKESSQEVHMKEAEATLNQNFKGVKTFKNGNGFTVLLTKGKPIALS